MSLIFNEAALDNLLQSPDGPVGLTLERVANQIAGNYEAVINIIWQNQSPLAKPAVDFDISFGDNGIQAEVGITDNGSVAEYMGNKFEIESDWIVPGLMTNWDSYI